MLVTLYWLARGWTELAAVGATVALLIKFQYAFVIPIVAIVGLKRHYVRPLGGSGAGRAAGPAARAHLAGRRARHAGGPDLAVRPLHLGAVAADPWPDRPLHLGANLYKGLTINAFNLWRNAWSGMGDTITWGCDAANPPELRGRGGRGPHARVDAGQLAAGRRGAVRLAALIAFWQIARRDDPEGLLFGALVLAVAFFALPTRVHERYMFPALALAAPLVLRRWPTSRGG